MFKMDSIPEDTNFTTLAGIDTFLSFVRGSVVKEVAETSNFRGGICLVPTLHPSTMAPLPSQGVLLFTPSDSMHSMFYENLCIFYAIKTAAWGYTAVFPSVLTPKVSHNLEPGYYIYIYSCFPFGNKLHTASVTLNEDRDINYLGDFKEVSTDEYNSQYSDLIPPNVDRYRSLIVSKGSEAALELFNHCAVSVLGEALVSKLDMASSQGYNNVAVIAS